MTETCDVVVVGLGVVGGAATRSLARAGVDVIGVDRYTPPHRLGSSHGETRITRLAVGEGQAYVPLVRRSHELWRSLEEETGEACYVACGGLVLAAPGSTGQHGVESFVTATIEIARRNGIEHEVLDADEIRARFPVLRPVDEVAYFEPTAGYLRTEACVAAQLAAATHDGARICLGEVVRAVEPRSAGVRVETDRTSIDAGAAVIAAGPWLASLVPSLAPVLSVERQVQLWFEIDGTTSEHERLPIYIWLHGPNPADLFYGFPSIEGRVKVATEVFGSPTSPEHVDRAVDATDVASMHGAHVNGRLLRVTSRCTRAEVCLYTVTPDFGFLVDSLPSAPHVVVASACSGHGFKHAPATGEAAAALALGLPESVDLTPFGFDRLDLVAGAAGETA